ncbi:unnamed protein product [Mytilus coruscus]|uniref:Retrotransposon gag domain-containing protein n=1 Tax=Mytilus coruscus TaxID=42192 RepID=A0A6J8A2Z0_MYTCO|nr:unnamed protein product [Mytilus coruscus]
MSESDNESVFTDDFLLYNQITDDIEPDIGYLLQPPASPLQLNTSFSLPNIETPATPAWTPFDQFQTSDFTNSSTPNTIVSSSLDDEFLSEFESYTVLHHILPEEDDRKIAAFHLHLCGPALTWFNTLPADNKQLWQTFEQVYKKQYIDVDFRSPTILLEGEIFETLKLSKGQSIDDFYAQLLEKATILHKSDHAILIKFIEGLPDQIAFFVRAGHHNDSANCLAAAKMGEAYGYRKDDAPLVAAVTKSANNTPAAMKDLNNFKTDVVSELQGQINSPTQAVSKLATDFSQQLDCSRDVKGNDRLFVTDENPDLGFTNVVQHQICLNPDFKPKHQRSYRLTPEKKDILRHHLDELLRQGVIAPVDETEDVHITSPVVLVSKRTYQKGKANTSSKDTSLSKFRFLL